MAKTNSEKDSFWQAVSIALFILIVSIVIGHITTSFKEKFTEHATRAPIHNMTAIEQNEREEEDAYRHIFENRLPTFLDHVCSPDCCHDNNMLTCSSGCICLRPEDKRVLKIDE